MRTFADGRTYCKGTFLTFLELLTFQIRPSDVLDTDKFKGRVFGKVWLRLGTYSPSTDPWLPPSFLAS